MEKLGEDYFLLITVLNTFNPNGINNDVLKILQKHVGVSDDKVTKQRISSHYNNWRQDIYNLERLIFNIRQTNTEFNKNLIRKNKLWKSNVMSLTLIDWYLAVHIFKVGNKDYSKSFKKANNS